MTEMIQRTEHSISNDDFIVEIILNRPETANALNSGLIDELYESFEETAKQQGARALILRGAGKHFCAGADLNWMKSSATQGDEVNRLETDKLFRMFCSLHQLPVPTLALVHGATYGGGVGLAAACDSVYAVEGSQFCLSEVRLGLIPAIILPLLRTRVLPGQLRHWGLTAEKIDTDSALQAGLVTKVVSAEKQDAAVNAYLRHILLGGPTAQGKFKELVADLDRDWNQPDVTQVIASVRAGAEAQHGMACFLNKTQPNYQHSWSPERLLSPSGSERIG